MIIEYHRPESLEAALALLARQNPRTLPLGGGTALVQPAATTYAVVDLQALGLDTITDRGNALDVGATTRLQALLDFPGLPEVLAEVIHLEASYNLRQVATLAGTIVAADGRSPLTTALLALDSRLTLMPGSQKIDLGDLLPVRSEMLAGRLITHITFPTNARLAYHAVSRTPADRPVVCAAVAAWPSGRVRVALGGFGGAPILAFDGMGAQGAELASRDACSDAQDEWASAEYRQEMAGVLTRRCLDEVAALNPV